MNSMLIFLSIFDLYQKNWKQLERNWAECKLSWKYGEFIWKADSIEKTFQFYIVCREN